MTQIELDTLSAIRTYLPEISESLARIAAALETAQKKNS